MILWRLVVVKFINLFLNLFIVFLLFLYFFGKDFGKDNVFKLLIVFII